MINQPHMALARTRKRSRRLSSLWLLIGRNPPNRRPSFPTIISIRLWCWEAERRGKFEFALRPVDWASATAKIPDETSKKETPWDERAHPLGELSAWQGRGMTSTLHDITTSRNLTVNWRESKWLVSIPAAAFRAKGQARQPFGYPALHSIQPLDPLAVRPAAEETDPESALSHDQARMCCGDRPRDRPVGLTDVHLSIRSQAHPCFKRN